MGESIAEVAAEYAPDGFMLVWQDGWIYRHRSNPARDFRPGLFERIRLSRKFSHLISQGADHDR